MTGSSFCKLQIEVRSSLVPRCRALLLHLVAREKAGRLLPRHLKPCPKAQGVTSQFTTTVHCCSSLSVQWLGVVSGAGLLIQHSPLCSTAPCGFCSPGSSRVLLVLSLAGVLQPLLSGQLFCGILVSLSTRWKRALMAAWSLTSEMVFSCVAIRCAAPAVAVSSLPPFGLSWAPSLVAVGSFYYCFSSWVTSKMLQIRTGLLAAS